MIIPVIPHEPLRRDMIEVDYLLTVHVKPEEPWKLVTFFSWYHNRFLPIVHCKFNGCAG